MSLSSRRGEGTSQLVPVLPVGRLTQRLEQRVARLLIVGAGVLPRPVLVDLGKGGLEAFKGFASAIRSALGSLPKLDVAAVGESVTTATEALREGAREGIEALSDFIAERFSGPPRQ